MPYTNIQDLEKEIIELWRDGNGEFGTIADLTRYIINEYGDFDRREDSLRRSVSLIINKSKPDKELLEQNVNLAKKNQLLQDKNRIERKAFREDARIENAVAAIGSELVSLNKKYADKLLQKINISQLTSDDTLEGIGVIHVTDTHFNEKIDLPHNQYNFNIAAKRLKKLTQESIDYFKYKKVKRVVIAYTGDLLNSDRRLDEILNAETNRAKAAALAAHIIRQQILHVRNAGFEVDIISVLGNESRVKQEMTFSNEAFSDNYDFTIMAQVRDVLTFSGINGIKFLSIDKMESVVNLGDYNVLFSHGINLLNSKQKDIQSIIGRYSQQGVKVDYIIYGHGHAFRGTDQSCQSSSLCGANTYSDHALGLSGRASGTCHVFREKEHSMQYIDLQDANNNGYEIVSQLEAYNIKSELKIRQQTAILSVVI